MGRGMSQASSLSAGESGQSTPKKLSPEEELLDLKRRAEDMREQIKDVESRIRTLEGK
jgi:hypothetical protein